MAINCKGLQKAFECWNGMNLASDGVGIWNQINASRFTLSKGPMEGELARMPRCLVNPEPQITEMPNTKHLQGQANDTINTNRMKRSAKEGKTPALHNMMLISWRRHERMRMGMGAGEKAGRGRRGRRGR